MKKLIIIICAIFGSNLPINAQIGLVFRLGYSPALSPKVYPIYVNRRSPHDEFRFNMVHVQPQFYAGIGAHLPLQSPFFLEGEVCFTQKKSLYMLDYLMPSEINRDVQYMKESENTIMVPVNIGVSLGSFDVTSGLTAMTTFSKKNELAHVDGFNQKVNQVQIGWQGGVRYAFHRVLFGVQYQGSLNVVGQGMSVKGQSLELKNVPGNVVFSIQYGISGKRH